MKGKQPLFIFALKRNKKYGSKTKQRKIWKQKNTEVERSEKKNTEAKRKVRKRKEAKIDAKFSLKKAKRKRNEYHFVSL